jgi:[protein-PII] uridylyltransferase
MALDNLLVLDARGRPYGDRRLRARLVGSVEAALSGAEPALPEPDRGRARSSAFRVAPSVVVADKASSRTTVVEINALDRPALLASLASAIRRFGHQIHSAHIATYGERAVDVFYLTRADGKKLGPEEIERLRAALLDAAHSLPPAKADAA